MPKEMQNEGSKGLLGKRERLFDRLRELDSLLVAFSGGADSAYLAWAAHHTLGERALYLLERGLAAFYAQVERQLGVAVSGRRGAGAAGGLGAAMIAFLGAELRPGIDLVIETVDLRSRLRDAAVVITGEGRIDAQTLSGKTAFGVARLAAQLDIPVIALGGSLADDAECVFAGGIDAIEAGVCRPQTLAQALAEARPNIERAGRRIAQCLLAARLR